MQYKRLLSPVRIGSVEVKNRVFMPPHTTNIADRFTNERHTAYYRERARGGVGLIVHEGLLVHPSTLFPRRVWGWEPDNIPLLRATTDAVHAEGARIFVQLSHRGASTTSVISQRALWGPSATAPKGEVSHAMTKREIDELVQGFGAVARNAQLAAFDGVEIHGAHGYLVQSFISPLTNRRDDEYGGTEEKRLRLLKEIVQSIRSHVGSEFVVGLRLSADELVPGGLSAEDMQRIARRIEDDCELDYFSISAGTYASQDRMIPDMSFPWSTNIGLAGGLKKTLNRVVVLAAGRIAHPDQAEDVLARGQADMIGMARQLIADPQWIRKVEENAEADIRPCTYGNECLKGFESHQPISCMVNALAGHELDVPSASSPARAARRVVVVGGGVAGMECAVTAASLGHEVVLFEASQHLGGQTRLAAEVELRNGLARIVNFLASALEREKVDVRLGEAATAEAILQERPDVVVVATGARAKAAAVPGVVRAFTAWDVLGGEEIPSGKVVVYDNANSGWAFCGLLDYLSAAGREVVAVTPSVSVGVGIEIRPLYRRLFDRGVDFRTMHRLDRVEDGTAILRHAWSGAEVAVADVVAVVVESGGEAVDGLAAQLEGRVDRVDLVGDAMAPRRIIDAIREGNQAARAV